MDSKIHHTFNIEDSVAYGWNIVKKNFKFCLISVIILGIVSWIFSFIQISFTGDLYNRSGFQNFLDVVFSIISLIINTIFFIGFTRIALSFLDGKTPHYSYLWDNLNSKIWKVIISSLLFLLIIAGGLVLLIVPGIIFLLRLNFYMYFIVDRDMGPIEALKASWRVTQNNVIKLFGVNIILMLLFIVSLLCYGLILYLGSLFGDSVRVIFAFLGSVCVFLIGYPFLFAVHLYVYRKLSGGHVSEPKNLTTNSSF